MRISTRVAGVLLVLLAAVGCVSRSGDDPAEDETTAAPPPTAADGNNVAACADGNCEIRLADELEVPTPVGTLSLTLDGDVLEYAVSSPGGSNNSGSAEGNCVITLYLDGTGGGSTCFAGGEPAELEPAAGELAMQVLGADTDSPVLVMATD